MNAIEVQGVTKRFGALEVLKGIDLTVHQGEIFTLLGENGAGKSTLINILATLSPQDAGSVRIMGCDVRRDGARVRQQISLNAQATTFDAEFTGGANLRLIARLRGLPDPAGAVAAVAKRLDLDAFLQRPVKTYSGGMMRRLDLAMSLLGDAPVIFLDEPTTGVDPKNRLALWAMIRGMRDAGKTVFLTTQYLDEADALSDRIAFIHDGVIAKSGTPAEIKQNTRATYSLQAEPRAAAVLAQAGIDYTQAGDVLTVAENDAPRGLQALLAAGVAVQHYNQDAADLATVFMAVTAKEA